MNTLSATTDRPTLFRRPTARPADAALPLLYRSEGFAEDLFDSHPGLVTLIGSADEPLPGASPAVQAGIAAALLATLAGCRSPHSA